MIKIAKEMEKKSKKWSNLKEGEKEGLDSLRERVGRGELVCSVTDKSGRWACDSLENYKKGCTEQLRDSEKTQEITKEEHNKGEREMNGHALALGRMLGLKEGVEGSRLRNVMTAEGSKIVPFYGMRKDHKEVVVGKEAEGPRMRPVCGAKEGHNKRVSYILCMMLTQLIPDNGTQCDSTDDLLAEIECINETKQVSQGWVIGSLEVDSL